MEKHIIIKEKIKKISLFVQNLDNKPINLIEKDILMKDICDLYAEVSELKVLSKTSVTLAYIAENQTIKAESQTVQYDNLISEVSEEEKEEKINDEIIEEQEVENISEEKPEENEAVINLKEDYSIEFLDEPEEKIEIAVEKSKPEEVKVQKPEIKRPEVEQASLFSNNGFNSDVKVIGEQFASNKTSLNEVLAQKQQQQEDISSIMNKKPIADIKSVIGIGDRFLFIRELFNGNSDVFDETISYLNSLSSFEEASSYLFNKFSWNESQDTVSRFINIVKRKYL